jgi:hypothetical protein
MTEETCIRHGITYPDWAECPHKDHEGWRQIERITAMRRELADLKRFRAAVDRELAKEASTTEAKEGPDA